MDFGGGCDLSLFVGGPVNIKGLEELDWSRWEEEMLDKRGVNEVSSSPAIYEGCSDDGSCSVL